LRLSRQRQLAACARPRPRRKPRGAGFARTTIGLAARKFHGNSAYGPVTLRCRGTRPLSESII
jgi:hypothetical protein